MRQDDLKRADAWKWTRSDGQTVWIKIGPAFLSGFFFIGGFPLHVDDRWFDAREGG
jgi:hypothetical protein